MRTTRSEQGGDEGPSGSEMSGSSKAVVVVSEPTRWSQPSVRHPSPDPTFVAQLIANAQALSPSHNHLGESAADALFAYRARQRRPAGAGRLTRQVI